MTLGRPEQKRLQLVGRDDEAAQQRRGDHVGAGRLVRQDRDLAEEVTAPEPCALLAVDHDSRLPVEDHVEAAAGHVLAEHALALGEDLLAERVRKKKKKKK